MSEHDLDPILGRGAAWVRHSLGVAELSPLGALVADLLWDLYEGIYHLDLAALRRVDWTHPTWLRVSVPASSLATYDNHRLTDLVILCHDRCVRCELAPAGPWRLALLFSPRVRASSSVDMMHLHPTLEVALERARRHYGPAR